MPLEREHYGEAGAALKVRAKRNKTGAPYATNCPADVLAAWLSARGKAPGPLLWPINKAGRCMPRRMTDQAVLSMVRKPGEEAGVEKFSPHDLRPSFISDVLDAGAGAATVSGLAGRASITTTARYGWRGDHAKRRAAEMLHVPFGGP